MFVFRRLIWAVGIVQVKSVRSNKDVNHTGDQLGVISMKRMQLYVQCLGGSSVSMYLFILSADFGLFLG